MHTSNHFRIVHNQPPEVFLMGTQLVDNTGAARVAPLHAHMLRSTTAAHRMLASVRTHIQVPCCTT